MSRLDSAVSQDQRSHAKTSLASGPLARIFYWLSSSGQPDSDELRGRLIQSIMDRKGALLVGTAVVIATATVAYFMTGAWWPIVWLVTEIVIVAVRLAVISHAEQTPGRRREDYVPALLTLGALWTVVFGAGTWRLVYHLDSMIFEEGHLMLDAVCFKADMMESGAVLGEEASDWRIVLCGAKKFDFSAPAEFHKGDFDFLLHQYMSIDDFAAHDVMIECASAVEIGYGHGDVGNVF